MIQDQLSVNIVDVSTIFDEFRNTDYKRYYCNGYFPSIKRNLTFMFEFAIYDDIVWSQDCYEILGNLKCDPYQDEMQLLDNLLYCDLDFRKEFEKYLNELGLELIVTKELYKDIRI